jgi:UDP-GlcNAc3NAcA epimerase
MKTVTIVGARPQIIKAAALSRAIKTRFSKQIEEIIVHTGQHYDVNMSEVFFNELGIPQPHRNLGIGSASHGKQTALMIQGIETILLEEKPDFLVLYGDTNSTLAGTIAASKLHVPIVHIEAGLRSFNKSMPEEINRIMCDHASTLLFVPTLAGIRNLEKEGFCIKSEAPFSIDNPGIFHCGDIMFDNLLHFSKTAEVNTSVIRDLSLKNKTFILCTIHRDNNTDIPERLNAIFGALNRISEECGLEVVLPMHPRTSKLLKERLQPSVYQSVTKNKSIRLSPPVSYLEMIALEKNASLILTDSGGVQKEAYFFKKPLVVARPETEWTEIIENGAGIIADADEEKIVKSVTELLNNIDLRFPEVFGDGHAAEFICSKMLSICNS